MNITIFRLLALCGLLAAGNAAAEGFALGVKGGTLGLGVEGTYGLSPRLNLRFGANGYEYSMTETASEIRYDADLDFGSGALLLDWHPFKGIFRVSAGYMYNDNVLRLKARFTEDQQIGGNTYTPDEIGTLSGEVDFKKSVPYAGIGWGNAARGRGLGFSLELGAMFQGSPDVTLSASEGLVAEADLEQEEREVEEDLENFKIYPVISLGLSYRF